MAQYTENLNLYKPSPIDSEIDIHTSLAQNFQNIEDHLGEALGTEYTNLSERFAETEQAVNYIMSVNIRKYGAAGDGTDATQAFLDAVTAMPTGGVINIPNGGLGDYVIDGSVELPSNIRFIAEEGVVLRKDSSASTSYMFTAGQTKGTTGYGGGAKNIKFENIIFQGRAIDETDRMSLSITLHHAENVRFLNCKFIDCITNGHALDLSGCNDIYVDNCWFIGAYNIAGREYTEAIQIDSSAPTSLSNNFSNYDGLPTKDVTVTRCKFVPSYNSDGSVKNYAPNPIGNHGFTGGKHYENIHFEHNLVYDGWEQTGTNWRAWIHFYGLKNSKFLNNIIVNPRGVKATPFGFYTSSNGRYNPDTYAVETGEPLPHDNIEVAGNHIEGFRDYSANSGLIFTYGTTYNGTVYRPDNINVHDNDWEDNYSQYPTDQSYERPLAQFNECGRVKFYNNDSNMSGRVMTAFSTLKVTAYANESNKTVDSAYYIADCDYVNVFQNTGDDMRRPFEISECGNVQVTHNTFTNVLQTAAETHANQFRNIRGGIIQGNYTQTSAGLTYGYYVYDTDGTSHDVKVLDNVAVGFTTDVNQTGTIPGYKYRGV